MPHLRLVATHRRDHSPPTGPIYGPPCTPHTQNYPSNPASGIPTTCECTYAHTRTPRADRPSIARARHRSVQRTSRASSAAVGMTRATQTASRAICCTHRPQLLAGVRGGPLQRTCASALHAIELARGRQRAQARRLVRHLRGPPISGAASAPPHHDVRPTGEHTCGRRLGAWEGRAARSGRSRPARAAPRGSRAAPHDIGRAAPAQTATSRPWAACK